jgi:hypothetical protein
VDDAYAERLKAKLAPESVGRTLILAGCFLSAYELIRSEVVDQVHDFYLTGFNQDGLTYDEVSYQQKVLALHPKSQYRASCAWLVVNGALTPEQVATLEEVYRHRKEIAHELPKLLIDPEFEVKKELLVNAIECVRRLGVFWGSIEVEINPDLDGNEVDYDEIKSGSYLLMEYLAQIAGLESHDIAEHGPSEASRPDHGN